MIDRHEIAPQGVTRASATRVGRDPGAERRRDYRPRPGSVRAMGVRTHAERTEAAISRAAPWSPERATPKLKLLYLARIRVL
jgi:hypothetical protein